MKKFDTPFCPVHSALQMLGGKWKLIILWNLLQRPYRFNELRRVIGDVSTKVLSDQLSQMEADGLVIRKAFPTSPPQVEYSVSSRGRALSQALESLHEWGKKYAKKS